jgi:hypothetical protein
VPDATKLTPVEKPVYDPDHTQPDENEPDSEKAAVLGRPREDGLPIGSRLVKPGAQDPAYTVPNPRHSKYYSDDNNTTKRTGKLWVWIKELPVRLQELIDVYVYREWPPLLPVPEGDDDYNNIDKFPATECFSKDEDLNDKYGAGDFKVYLNVGLKPHRRTIATAWVKGNRNFRDLPPSDRRITEMGEDGFPKWIDRHDPQCKTYVEWLRSRGIIPEVHQAEKERMKMEQTETAKESMNTVERMADKMIKMAEAKAATPTPPPAGNGLGSDTINNLIEASMAGAKASTEILKDTIKTLQEGAAGGGRGGNDATAMLTIALEIADKISKANDATPYLNIISKLNESVMALKMEMLNEKIESLRQPAAATAPAAAAPGLKSIIEDFMAVKELVGGLGGDVETPTTKMPWWAGMLSEALPHISSMVQSGVGLYMASQARPMAGGMPNQPQMQPQPQPAPQPQQPQPQGQVLQMIPSPQPQPTPQAQQPNGTPAPMSATLPTDSTAILLHTINMIRVPFSNYLHDDSGGDVFADWFIGGYGEKIYNELKAYKAEGLMLGLYSYPPMVAELSDVPREQVEKFVQEFCAFDEAAFDRKVGKPERGPVPVA